MGHGHACLDGIGGLESIQLVQQLQHCTLDFRIAALAAAPRSCASDRVDLVHEDNGRLMLPAKRYDEGEAKTRVVDAIERDQQSPSITWPPTTDN